MRDSDCRVRGIHGLAAWTGGTERVDPEVLGIDLDVHFFCLGHYRDGDGRGMYAALLLGGRNALYPVDAAFVLEAAIHFIAAHQGNDFLQTTYGGFAGVRDLPAPSLGFGKAGIHAEDLRSEQRGFVTAGAGADLE